jgi:hypothetical protein
MTRRILSLALGIAVASIAAACGGAVEQPVDGNAPAPASSLKSANAEFTPWGVWNLVSLERSDDPALKVHDVLQLDVRTDGTVIARRCGKQYYEQNSLIVRCGDEASYDCYYGTVTRDESGWHVDLPDLPTTDSRDERIIDTITPGETIKIHHIMPRSEAGVFTRTLDDMRFVTSSSFAVGNCKSGG